jgi:hypothetical protein
MKNFTISLQLAGIILSMFLFVYGLAAIFGHFTRTAMYSHELPPNIVCIRDTFPDGYICMPEYDAPWYIEPVGELAQVN